MFDVYAGLLKMSPIFQPDSPSVSLAVDFSGPELNELRGAYQLAALAGDGDTFSRARRLLLWVSDGIHHNGNANLPDRKDALSLLRYSFHQGQERGINCAGLSTVLTSCLLAMGITARVVYILPASPYDMDNHVVVHVYLSEEKRWIMMDPTFGAYAMDESGRAMDLLSLRERFANQQVVRFNPEMHYNGQPYDPKEYLTYLAKDLYWFQVRRISCCHSDQPCDILNICPLGFQPYRFDLANVDYRLRMQGEQPWLLAWRESLVKAMDTADQFLSPESLILPPRLT